MVDDEAATAGETLMTDDFETTVFPPSSAEPARPVVVIQYRKKGLLSRLIGPVLIVVVASAVISQRSRIGNWRGLADLFGRTETVRKPMLPEPPVTADTESNAATRPLVIHVPEPPAPPVVSAQPPEKPRLSTPPLPPEVEVAALLRPSPLVITLPTIESPKVSQVDTERAFEGIRLAAAEERAKKAEMAKADELKARLVAQDEANADARRTTHEADLRKQMEESRLTFRKDLEQILNKSGQKGSAREIVTLCRREGVSLGTDLRRNNKETREGLTAEGRRVRIQKSRAMQLSEATILDDLVRVIASNSTNARAGPKSLGEFIETAAQELLQAPIRDLPPLSWPLSPTTSGTSVRRQH